MATVVRQCDGIDQALTPQGEATPTIFARSTGALPSAIAIVRVSGPQSAAALEAMTRRALPSPRAAVIRRLYDAREDLLDSAMVLWLPGPDTVTGEDLVEFHLHGSRAVVAGVETALSALPGLQAAEPGEFTRRAFENGRMDLSQVEGLADLLSAETARQRTAALTMAEGGLRRAVEDWQVRLLDLAARIEASIDHEDEPDVVAGPLDADTRALVASLDSALAHPPAERLRDGVRIGIAGPPNAGKSTLINALAGREAAIVSPIAGTTRDLVEVSLNLDGIPVVLIDMAGLRADSLDPIEQIGIARAEEAMTRCDLILWLGVGDEVPEGRVMTVATKSDIEAGRLAEQVVSAITGDGIDALRAAIRTRAEELLPSLGELTLSTGQRGHLAMARDGLIRSVGEVDDVLRAEAVLQAMVSLDRITGRADTEAMLDALFGRFCIGK
ncbi:MAG: tRNA uridine-5-carboxymethylaminomethyl(34) synthesis GTPase MnmE [Sphingomonadales bacterium]